MENKKYKAFLRNDENVDFLILNLDKTELKINLNSEDQTSLRTIFYKVIEQCFTESFQFEYIDNQDYPNKLFNDIAADYIKKLNTEIANIKNDIDAKENEEELDSSNN